VPSRHCRNRVPGPTLLILRGYEDDSRGNQEGVNPWTRRVGLAAAVAAAMIIVLVAAYWGVQRL
jgi:hypothetical protein